MNNEQNEYYQNGQPLQDGTEKGFKLSTAGIITIVVGVLMIVCCFLPYYSFEVSGMKSSASLFQCIFGIGKGASLEDMLLYKAAENFLKDTFIGNLFLTLIVLVDVLSGVIFLLSKNKTVSKAKKASVETVLAGLAILIFTVVMAVLTIGKSGISVGFGAIALCILALAFNFALSKCLPRKEKKQKK